MKENIDNDEKMMRKWCRFVSTTIADPILESYRIMPIRRLWRLWPPTSDLVIPTLSKCFV